ncbi:MAG TPA: hypothetical protein ACFYD2_09950 [Candidatus Avalokitesvara rifleensis]|uniref:hypothetical protein n=1 Tax=Candidatus Avalokitesvara rifleensis TaxID=3367620 RepID=UPI00402A2D4E
MRDLLLLDQLSKLVQKIRSGGQAKELLDQLRELESKIEEEGQMKELLDQLHELVKSLLLESMKKDYTGKEQEGIHEEAKEIRKRLVQLRQKQFDQNTEGYKEATAALGVVNNNLQTALNRINNLTEFFGNTARLGAALDKLIQAGVSAV